MAKTIRSGMLERILHRNNPCTQLRISASVQAEIRNTIGSLPAEEGGVLGGNRKDGVVTHYYFDLSADRTGATYSPDHERLNRLFKEDWNPKGVYLLGAVHSHQPALRFPSQGDLLYARRILHRIPDLKQFLLPIVMTEPDNGRFEILPYTAIRDGDDVRLRDVELVLEHGLNAVQHVGRIDTTETFRRVRSAYDLDLLARCRMIYIGVGGAAAFCEEMGRAGVGEHVFIDGDVVSESNLATQQTYRRDIGRFKVDCVAERIRDINPNASVVARPQWLDEITDTEFQRLATASLGENPPLVTLICGLSDDFKTQARVNRLALHFGLPSLCAQVYREGRAAEITFTYPGVTPACHRCILSSRYKAYLEKGFQNDVTSDGTPIFATTRLNALKGFIALAILHHDPQIPIRHHRIAPWQIPGFEGVPVGVDGRARWGTLLERIGNRNLIQIRMDPDLGPSLGLRVFDRVFGAGDHERILFDDAVWLPQEPDCFEGNGRPTCPDCGGMGDLRKAIGSFADTGIMREGG